MTRALLAVVVLLGAATTRAGAQPSVDTSGWKTYRNQAMGFEVRHPAAWHASEAKGTGPESALVGGSTEGGKRRTLQFWVQRQINPEGLPIERWFANQLQRVKGGPQATTPTTLGGRPAIRWERTSTIGRDFVFFTTLNRHDIFQVTLIQGDNELQLDPTCAAVLSTLRLLD